MSFAFGFGGDDIGHDSDDDELSQHVQQISIDDVPVIAPKKHTLHDLLGWALTHPQLKSLPSQVSYNLLPIARIQNEQITTNSGTVVPRRSVFDIRTQLMAEANPDENDNDALLAGLERGDLTSGFYEGGFKTWECSLDLASLLLDLNAEESLHVVELGAGSSVPSLVGIGAALHKSQRSRIHFTLCDYNEEVLRLATAPNVFLSGALRVRINRQNDTVDDLDFEDIDEECIQQCSDYFTGHDISFDFVSGGWGDDFVSTIQSTSCNLQAYAPSMLILASETIYSPESTSTFVRTLMQLLRQDPTHRKAWIAAKKVYFGVGGGVDDFVYQVLNQGGNVSTLLDVQGVGVGRVVLEVTVGLQY